jgi:hypothetical protein
MRGFRRSGGGPIALVAILVLAMAVLVSRSRGRSSTLSSVGAAPVITLAWNPIGKDVEPWSGLGLGEQVRRALHAEGVAVTDDGLGGTLGPAGDAESLIALGRKANATYVLAGTVGRKGERSEVGMQLVRVRDGVLVWASTFWRDPGDLESLASDLAAAIAEVLEAETCPGGEPP